MYKGGRRLFRPPFLFNLKFKKMAVIKLGSIVTDIAGSIGGTTFRRTPHNPIMYNKQGRQFRSANSVNSQATALGNIFRSWGNLPQGIRAFWYGIAPLYPQKDKFGNDILLTGRQLYTKLNAQLLPAQRTVDISVFTDVLSAPLVTSILFDISSQSCEIFFENEVLNSYLLLRVYPLRSGSNAVVKNSSKFIFCLLLNEVASLGISEAVLETFPFAKAGDRFGVNVIFMNSSGFRSNVQSFVIIAT